jgi:hypothetical protein
MKDVARQGENTEGANSNGIGTRESGRRGFLEGKGKRNHARHTSHTEECLEWNFSVLLAIRISFRGQTRREKSSRTTM